MFFLKRKHFKDNISNFNRVSFFVLKKKPPDIMYIIQLSILLLFSISACDDEFDGINKTDEQSVPWLCQLQGADVHEIKESGFPLVVIDYSKDGGDSRSYSHEEIQELINDSIIPVSYISIGEAENYRFYWDHEWVEDFDENSLTDKAPTWLGHSNPNWIGNYKVRYWDTDWRDNYLSPYLDKIISQGFRGIYLDIVDAYGYWYDPNNYGGGDKEEVMDGDPINNKELACERMIELVIWISEYCKSNSPFGNTFLIFPQNGLSILDFDNDGAYMNAIDGAGVESVWYFETSQREANAVDYRLQYLRKVIANNKMVLAVDYVDDGSGFANENEERITDFIMKCKSEKFRYYVARSDRKLNEINIIEEIQP